MSGLKPPRRKRRIYQDRDSPFPIPIESVTQKPASSSRWFYYTGLLQENCVLVQQEGDVIFLYKMGFFGKGMLSKSKPEHSFYVNSYQGLHKKNLPPKERRFQQQRFQQVRKKRYERHLSWAKQFVTHSQGLMAEIDEVTSRTDDATMRTDDVTTRTDDVTTRTDDVTTNTDDVSTRTDDFTRRTDDVTTRTDDVTMQTDDVTMQTDDVTMRTDVTMQTDVTMSTDDVTTRPDVVTTRTDVTTRPDNVTMKPDDVTTRPDDVSTRTDDVSTRTDDISTRTDDVGTRTDDITMRTNDIIRTDDVTTRTDDIIVQHNLMELSAIQGVDKMPDVRTNATRLKDGCKIESDTVVTKDTKDTSSCEVKSSSESSDTEGVGSEDGTRDGRLVRKVDPYPIYEYLNLKFEEAFFLSYGLGCLSVLDGNKKAMDLTEMWQAFCSRQKNFVSSYVAYHYFRSKGWVPRDGIKYGAHYVLYKHGPPFYHGSYSVIVQMVTEGLWDSSEASNKLTWPALSGMDRITETVAKEVMFCYVIRPSDLSDEDMLSPKCIPRFRVQEIIIRRWVSSRERDGKNQLTPVIS